MGLNFSRGGRGGKTVSLARVVVVVEGESGGENGSKRERRAVNYLSVGFDSRGVRGGGGSVALSGHVSSFGCLGSHCLRSVRVS